jgi:hypothetical protein
MAFERAVLTLLKDAAAALRAFITASFHPAPSTRDVDLLGQRSRGRL